MKRRRCTDGHVREGHIIVDGSHQANDFQVTVLFNFFITNIACFIAFSGMLMC